MEVDTDYITNTVISRDAYGQYLNGSCQYSCVALTQLFLLNSNDYNSIFSTQLPSVLFIPREFAFQFKSIVARILH